MQAEVWKVLPRYPKYSVSNLGRVKNRESGRVLKPRVNVHGYLALSLAYAPGLRRDMIVHRLVAEAFVPGQAPGLEVNHINGCKTDCYADNLEWVTKKENIAHAIRTGLNQRTGPVGPRRKVRVVETGEVFANQSACARVLGVSQAYINRTLSANGGRNVRGYHLELVD